MTIIYHNGKIYKLKKDDSVIICNDYIEIITAKQKEVIKAIGQPINSKLNCPESISYDNFAKCDWEK